MILYVFQYSYYCIRKVLIMRNKKSTILYSTLVILSSILIFYLLISRNTISKIHFIQFESYVAAPEKSQYTIDLVYFVNKFQKDIIEDKNIDKIELKNAEDVLNISNFSIIKGENTNKYSIKTLSLEIDFLFTSIKKVQYVNIYFTDGTKESFKIGQWIFDINSIPIEGNHLSIGDKYPFMSKFFDGCIVSVNNTSQSDIFIKSINIDLPNIKFLDLDKSIEIKKGSSFNTRVIPDGTYNKYNFYFIKPKIVYSIGEVEYTFYPYGIHYGLLNLTEDAIKNEINKTK